MRSSLSRCNYEENGLLVVLGHFIKPDGQSYPDIADTNLRLVDSLLLQ